MGGEVDYGNEKNDLIGLQLGEPRVDSATRPVCTAGSSGSRMYVLCVHALSSVGTGETTLAGCGKTVSPEGQEGGGALQ